MLSSTIFTTFSVILLTAMMAESKPQTYIVGGSQVQPGDFPYFVDMDGCGGTLIAPDTVLTAAHCGDMTGKQIVVGAYQTASLEFGAHERFCETWVSHPGWNPDTMNNDFALCKLNTPVENIDDSVKLEWNRDPAMPADQDDLIVIGLGALAYQNHSLPSPEFLRSVTVPAISNEDCSSMYGDIIDITPSMVCAGVPEGGKDACQGDSGGPIVKRVPQADGSYVDFLVGVVSFGYECARANKPGVYARTSAAREFIEDTVCEEFHSVAFFCENNNNNLVEPLTTPATPPCEAELEVVVETDAYGSETNWSLTEQDSGHKVLRRTYMLSHYRNSHSLCVSRNTCYSFAIRDAYGDGLCADNSDECGFYELKIPHLTEPFARGGEFAASETIEFCIDDAGNQVDELPINDKDNLDCQDQSDFKLRGKTCRSIGKKRRGKAEKLCRQKKGRGKKIVADFCPETCGKVGVGNCDHLKEKKKKKKKKKKKNNQRRD